jgi:hypothetical protein
MSEISRRNFTKAALGAFTTYAFLESAFQVDAFSAAVKPITNRWAVTLNQLSLDLRGRRLKPVEWQNKVEELMSRVDLAELMRFINFERLIRSLDYPDAGPTIAKVSFPAVEGLPTDLAYSKKIFAMRKDRSIIPHGHVNMATSHLVLRGSLHLRNFDRIERHPEHLLIRPSIDRVIHPGEDTTISEDHNNVHWFTALTDTAYTFDVVVQSLDPKGDEPTLDFIDPDHGERLSGDLIRAKRIPMETALSLYGKELHPH